VRIIVMKEEQSVSERVLVTGATGGVGQLTVAKLLKKGYPVRVLTRNAHKAQQMFNERVEVAQADTRHPDTLKAQCKGSLTLFAVPEPPPSPLPNGMRDINPQANEFQRLVEWSKVYFNSDYRRARSLNSPEQVDAEGVSNLVAAVPKDLKRFVFVSSCGIERKDKLPYSLLNTFGVLDAKQKGELSVIQSGLPYTIIRPGRLIDGLFTSFDLNTLLKATTGGKLGIVIGTGDTLSWTDEPN